MNASLMQHFWSKLSVFQISIDTSSFVLGNMATPLDSAKKNAMPLWLILLGISFFLYALAKKDGNLKAIYTVKCLNAIIWISYFVVWIYNIVSYTK